MTAFLALLFEATFFAAFYVRSEFLLRTADAAMILRTIGVVIGVKLVIFYALGICHRPWRTARFEDLTRLLVASTVSLVLLAAVNSVAWRIPAWQLIPRSVLLLDWAFTLLLVGGIRAVARLVYEEIMPSTPAGSQRAVLVVEASPTGQDLTEALGSMRHPETGGRYLVAGILGVDRPEHGRADGRTVGSIHDVAACAQRLRVAEVIVPEGCVFGVRLRALCDACDSVGVRVRIADRIAPDEPARLRDVGLHDLLSRPQARLSDHDSHVHPFVRGRKVLVTGAGGSIGSEICRQLMRFEPARLLLVERAEGALFDIHRELTSPITTGSDRIEAILCDITNADRLERLLADHVPEVIIHAAAFKHVSLMETHPVEAIENNAIATAMLAEMAEAHGVETFVALSTDKAVHPSSVMGASKLVAERFLQAFARHSSTRFVAVRFGNVIGSSGSAVPIFEEQLERRLPITVTHPDVTRYFMTINEAAQLVLLAGSLPEGGTYVLEMGAPIPIVDLVSRLAYVMRVPQDEVRIEFCGLRPGEKLSEELFFADEEHEATINPLVTRVTRPVRQLAEVRQWVATLKAAAADGPDVAIAALMDIAAGDKSPDVAKPRAAAGNARLARQGASAG